jgi:LemA protein
MSKIRIIFMGAIGLLIVGVLLLGLSAVGAYSGLVGRQQGVNRSQYHSDLVPNLVKTVEGSASFEKSTLETVVNAGASAGQVSIDASRAPDDAATLQKFQAAQGQFSSALQRLP